MPVSSAVLRHSLVWGCCSEQWETCHGLCLRPLAGPGVLCVPHPGAQALAPPRASQALRKQARVLPQPRSAGLPGLGLASSRLPGQLGLGIELGRCSKNFPPTQA